MIRLKMVQLISQNSQHGKSHLLRDLSISKLGAMSSSVEIYLQLTLMASPTHILYFGTQVKKLGKLKSLKITLTLYSMKLLNLIMKLILKKIYLLLYLIYMIKILTLLTLMILYADPLSTEGMKKMQRNQRWFQMMTECLSQDGMNADLNKDHLYQEKFLYHFQL